MKKEAGDKHPASLKSAKRCGLVVSAAGLEALAAVNRLGAFRLERNLGLNATTSANGIVQLTGSAAAVTAATTVSATATTAATGSGLFCGITARFALLGLLEPFGEVKLLLFPRKRKICTASCTDQLFVFHLKWPLVMSTD